MSDQMPSNFPNSSNIDQDQSIIRNGHGEFASTSQLLLDGFSSTSNLQVFRRHLGALLAVFQTLQQDDRTKAVSMTREALGRMQTVVKYQLCNDALRTVAALAETMIQEAYGFKASDDDLAYASSPNLLISTNSNSSSNFVDSNNELRLFPILSSSSINSNDRIPLQDVSPAVDLSIDNTDVLTNALYATLQAVNPCELSPPIQQQSISFNGLNSNTPPSSISFQNESHSTNGQSISQLTLNSFFQSTITSTSPTTNTKLTTTTKSDQQQQSIIKNHHQLFQCRHCDYLASHRQNLHRHEKLHELKHLPYDESRPYRCAFCDRRFVTKWALKEHTKCKHPSSSTTVDDRMGTTTDNDEQSMEESSTNAVEILLNRNFKCEYCEKSFPLKNALKRHVDSVHFKTRDYKCSNCDKAFADNYHLQRHIQSVHMALRVHECAYCGKAFSTAYHMNRHVKSLH